MAEKDAADRRPRRAFSDDDPSAGSEGTPTGSPRARRSLEAWHGDDAPGDDRTPTPTVSIQPATPPVRDVHITPTDQEHPAGPADAEVSRPEGPSAPTGPWGRPGPMPTDPRPTSAGRPTQRSASSPPPMWHEPHRHVLDRRTRTGLLVSALALLLVASLSVTFAVWANQRPQVSAPVAPTSSTPSPSPTPVLNRTSMLTDAAASEIDPDAAWKISLDADQVGNESPQATCIVADQPGLPVPESTRLRTLTTSTDLAALHQADLYPTSEDAQAVFQSRLGQLGGCAKQPVYLADGQAPAELGNESGGVVAVVQDEVSVHHSLLLVRSGRMVNVIDVAQQDAAVGFDGVVAAAAEVVNSQCGKTAGRCATDAEPRTSVPPLGTEEPGFLAGADVPRLSPAVGEWGGTPAESEFDLTTSQCEGMNPATVSGATERAKVTYLLRDDPGAPQAYGFDEVVLTMEDAETATSLREDFDEAVADCPDELRTAEVSDPVELEGQVGGSTIAGNAYTVTQSVEGSDDIVFRIALATIDSTAVYLVLPTTEDFDFSDTQWRDVAVRAAERTTQS